MSLEQGLAAVMASDTDSELSFDDFSGDDGDDGSILVDSNDDIQPDSPSLLDDDDDQQVRSKRSRVTATPPAPQLVG